MRKIEKRMVAAITSKSNFKLSNTRVEYSPELNTTMRACIEHARVYLYGNHIGTYVYSLKRFDHNPRTLALWPTQTTKSRIRALNSI